MTDDTDDTTTDIDEIASHTTDAATISSTYKILGEDALSSGAGVLGRNTAGSGTPIGVEGAVANTDGYGLSTPDDARIDGVLEATSGHTLTVGGDPGLRLAPTDTDTNGSGVTYTVGGSVVGGYEANTTNGALGATIAGGGAERTDTEFDFLLTAPNEVTDRYGTVGGGAANQAGDATSGTTNAEYATVAGGRNNLAGTDRSGSSTGVYATVGGGYQNTASDSKATVGGGERNTASGDQATVGGGFTNTASGDQATVGGGEDNTASGPESTVGGGFFNTASGNESTVGGGNNNTASGRFATVGGGRANAAGKSGTSQGAYATVPGGRNNVARGDYSLAAGRGAEAVDDGTFLWADSTSGSVTSASPNSFLVDVDNGVGINTTAPEAPLDVDGGNSDLNNSEGDFRIGNTDHRLEIGVATAGGGAGIANIRSQSSNINKINLGAGTNNILSIQGDSVNSVYPASDSTYSLGKSSNKWTAVYADNGTIQSSDARLKTNVSDIEDGLERVSALRPVSYEWEETGTPDDDPDEEETADSDGEVHLGLLAQEVADAVPEAVVEPDDGDGYLGVNYETLVPVLVGAVQSQQETIADLERENDRGDERVEDLEATVADLETRLATLEAEVAPDGDAAGEPGGD